MKRLIIFCLMCSSLTVIYAQDYFMYVGGEKHYFEISPNKVIVQFDEKTTIGSAKSIIQKNTSAIVKQCKLYQNAPNPFSEKTAIKYFLPTDIQQASVCIFDMRGKPVKKINAPAGENTLIIKGSELHAGMYLYSLIADGKEVDTKRMILTK